MVESNQDSINLDVLFRHLWKYKIIIMVCSFMSGLVGVLLSFLITPTYKSTMLLAPISTSSSSGFSSISRSFGGLAELAGVSLGGNESSIDLAIATLQSRRFLINFIKKYELKDEIFATTAWDSHVGSLSYNEHLYDPYTNQWALDEEGSSLEPSDLESYEAFLKLLTISQDKLTDLVTVGLEYKSPVYAKLWLTMIAADINDHFKNMAIVDANKSIEHLNKKLNDTSIADMKLIFATLVQQQVQNRMLAETKDDFVFTIVDPPFAPEEKASPRRKIFLVMFLCLGGGVAVFTVIIRIKHEK